MAWSGSQNDIVPGIISAFTTPVTVSTETPLFALAQLGATYGDLAVTLRNLDGVNAAALCVDTSQSGAVVDANPTQVIVPALCELTVEFRDILRLYWAVSASGDPANAFPPVQVQFQIIGRGRFSGGVSGPRYARGAR